MKGRGLHRGLVGEGNPAPLCVAGSAPPVLALHGFGGTPLEIALAVEVAESLGLEARAPLLTGHGTKVADLARSRYRDWLADATAAFDELAARGPVVVVGLSMGSLLAAELCATRPEAARGLVMLANAAWLTPPTGWLLSAVTALGVPDFSVPKLAADIGDPVARKNHLTYPAQPVLAAADLHRNARRVRGLLGRVRCPALVLHGARDRICPASNAERVHALLGSSDKRVEVFARSRHILTRDLDRAMVRATLAEFLQRLRSPQTPVEP